MNTERIKEIQNETAYPESVSVQQALLKVWNETEQKSGSVFPCFTESGEIFAIAESHSQAIRIAKDRYGEDIPDEMLAAIIDEWKLGKHYR